MDPVTGTYLGISLGSKLLGGLLSTRSERRRQERLRSRLLANLRPMEALLGQAEFGQSESEGNIARTVTSRTLRGLAGQGLINSSIAAPSVAQAVAPIEAGRQARRASLLERLTAARAAIYSGTEMPGYGAAFGGVLDQGGDLLALLAGQRDARSNGMQLQDDAGAYGYQEEDDPLEQQGYDAMTPYRRR